MRLSVREGLVLGCGVEMRGWRKRIRGEVHAFEDKSRVQHEAGCVWVWVI